MNKKLLLLALISALLLSGCIPVAFAKTMKNRGHYVSASIGLPENLDPAWVYDSASAGLLMNVYEPLIFFKREPGYLQPIGPVDPKTAGYVSEFEPRIATEWVVEDTVRGPNTKYTFKLRNDVWYHDYSRTVEAEDVEWSIERAMVMDHAHGPQWMFFEPLLGIYGHPGVLTEAYAHEIDDSVTTIHNATGDYVVFHLAIPYPVFGFLTILAQPWASPLKREWAAAVGCWPGWGVTGYDPAGWEGYIDPAVSPLATPTDEILGSGPYEFDYWTRGVEWSIVRFDDYYGWETDPHTGALHAPWAKDSVQRATVKLITWWATRRIGFLAGDYDSIYVPRQYMYDLITDWEYLKIAISDPDLDAFENGLIPEGRVPVPHTHPPPEPPYVTHNDAALVSHDIYDVVPSPVPAGTWALEDYAGLPGPSPTWLAVVEYALITSPLVVDGAAEIQAPSEFYWKEGYGDYAPSGMPDFDQRQDTWTKMCAPTAVANSLWWLDSKFEPDPSNPPPTVNDGFPLVTSYIDGIDDHDPANVQPFIEHLAYLMDTNGQRTGFAHSGTYVGDRDAGLAQYLSWTGVNPQGDVNGDGIVDVADSDIVAAAFGASPGMPGWNMAADIYPVTTGWPGQLPADNVIDVFDAFLVADNLGETGMFYKRTVQAPGFNYIKGEVERGQDVVISLGYWYYDENMHEWQREDYPYPWGHAVTAAGFEAPAKPAMEQYAPGIHCFKDLPALALDAMFFTLDINPTSPFMGVPGGLPAGDLDESGIAPDFFQDEHVRKGIKYLLDFDNYLPCMPSAWFGEAIQPSSPMIDGLPYSNLNNPIYSYDLAKATQYFKDAYLGHPEDDGGTPEGALWDVGFTMDIVYNIGNRAREVIASMIKDGIDAMGNAKFHVSTLGIGWGATYIPLLFTGQLPLYIGGWSADFADPHNFAYPFMHSAGAYGGPQVVSAIPESPRIDALIEDAIGITDSHYEALTVSNTTNVDKANPVGSLWTDGVDTYEMTYWTDSYWTNVAVDQPTRDGQLSGGDMGLQATASGGFDPSHPTTMPGDFVNMTNTGTGEWKMYHVKTVTGDPTLLLEHSRAAYYYELQQIYYEACPSVSLAQPLGRHWQRDWVQGWYYNPLYGGSQAVGLGSTAPAAPVLYFWQQWKEILGDTERDGDIDIDDLGNVLIGWPDNPLDPTQDIAWSVATYGVPWDTDIDVDNYVDVDDLGWVLWNY